MEVPVIDLQCWFDGHDVEVAEAVDQACRSVGFMQVVGHAIEPDVIDAMLTAADEFFSLPLTEKLAAVPSHPGVNRGYAAMGTEALAYSLGVPSARPDLFEAFNIGPDDVDRSDPFYAKDPYAFFAENVWPDAPARLRPALNAYFKQANRVALQLTEIFAVALGLESGWLSPFVDRSTATMRVNHYERRPEDAPPDSEQMRMGAHTDYGIVTVLYADPVPGLQIVGADRQWHDVVPVAGALLVNLGDLTAQWTNDRWRSTLHRVVPPPADGSGSALRRSVAFFLDGNYDATIECLATCTTPDNPPRYSPTTAGEHLTAKLLGPRTLTTSAATGTVGDRLDTL
jgi:isopenicillin N synthase-like dioxygenase